MKNSFFTLILIICFTLFSCNPYPSISTKIKNTEPEEQPEIEEKNNNCYLSKIDFSCGFLSPDFDKDIYNYTLYIPWNIESEYIEIIPTAEDSKATVSESYKKNLYNIPDCEYVSFTVRAENSSTKSYSIKISRYDRNVVFSYGWSLDTDQITITNLSKQKSYFILATSTPILNESNKHDYALIEINEELKPSETKILNAYHPTNLTSKPTILFSTDKGTIFEYSGDFIETLFLDYRETYNGEISSFSEMYSISDREDKYGNYSTFSWIDRSKGQFKISGRENKELMQAYIGNITAVTHEGNSTYLKAIRYFVGEKTQWLEWKNNISQ